MIRARIVTAFLLVAVAWGGALYVRSERVTHHHPSYRSCLGACLPGSGNITRFPAYTTRDRPMWADPVALALVIGSLGVGAALLPLRRA